MWVKARVVERPVRDASHVPCSRTQTAKQEQGEERLESGRGQIPWSHTGLGKKVGLYPKAVKSHERGITRSLLDAQYTLGE